MIVVTIQNLPEVIAWLSKKRFPNKDPKEVSKDQSSQTIKSSHIVSSTMISHQKEPSDSLDNGT